MARLRMMRAPQKYVQGRDALFKFYDEMKDFGRQMVVYLLPEVDTRCAMIKLKEVLKVLMTFVITENFLEESPVQVKLRR